MLRKTSQALLLALGAMIATAHAAAPAFDSGGAAIEYRRLDDALRHAYRGRFTDGLADVEKVIADMPHYADAYLVRADLRSNMGLFAEASADLDRVGDMHPDARIVPLMRAEIALRQRQGRAALAALAFAGTLPTTSVWKHQIDISGVWSASIFYADRSIAEELAGDDKAALDDITNMLRNESERPWYILSHHCTIAAIAGLLQMAELTCTEAVQRNAHDIGEYDSMGLVHLKMKQWDSAIADYGKALYYRPNLTLSLYGRGLAKRATGDAAGATADIAAATRQEPDIANIMARLGAPPI